MPDKTNIAILLKDANKDDRVLFQKALNTTSIFTGLLALLRLSKEKEKLATILFPDLMRREKNGLKFLTTLNPIEK